MSFSINRVVGATAVLAGATAIYQQLPGDFALQVLAIAIGALHRRIPLDFAIPRPAGENLIAPNKVQVLGTPFAASASYLKNGTWSSLIRKIGYYCEGLWAECPGIIYSVKDCEYGLCTDHVASKIGTSPTSILLYPDTLISQGYEIVPTPQKNDVVIYFWADKTWGTHIGLVSAVKNDAVWVESKWGEWGCNEHLEEAVPLGYGDAVVYLRKK